jgi:hypothetical protein
MTRFLHWRKMTWAIVLWNVGLFTWIAVGATSSNATADCATDFGATSGFLTQQDCLSASTGSTRLAFVLTFGLWLIGFAVLSFIWFETRALWRQGHGFRFHRLRAVEIPWKHPHVGSSVGT